ncbi:MAG: hypothetical protein RIB47_07030 [Cyclobacteriaceae bacterium]
MKNLYANYEFELNERGGPAQKRGGALGEWAEAFLGLDFLFTFSSMEKVKAQRLERQQM